MKKTRCDICGMSYSFAFGGVGSLDFDAPCGSRQRCVYCEAGIIVRQIQLPAPDDTDEHPRLLFNGESIHAGESFQALMPDGAWYTITLEVDWDKTGAGCWYISTEDFRHLCPVGLFVHRETPAAEKGWQHIWAKKHHGNTCDGRTQS